MGIPLKLNYSGHYVLSATFSGKENSKSTKGSAFSAPSFEWAFVETRPNLSNGGLRLPSVGGWTVSI